ncbi:fungal-specific transcription factor domain-containing protein [Aspergillus pseudoustus]|uniref:Fungal-specific transcription factor domain-containing protein n=1 Tax=Aspergillus pseudoustus TaxID=1810923 RepID=A0ABR4L1M0_9EURO
MHACERCYSRKTKCDRRLPQCTSCIKSKAPCRYQNKRRDRQLQQGYLKSVETRLKLLEQENEELRRNSGAHVSLIEPNTIAPSQSPESTRDSVQHRVDAQPSPVLSGGPTQQSPSEEARYLGSSNGVDFVDVVERVVDSSSHSTGGLFGRVTDSHRAPERVALPAISEPVALVDHAIAIPLIESYFEHWHLTFPLLYRPAFMEMVQHMYADPLIYHQDAAGAFAFDIVLALGSVPSKRVDWGSGHAESHFARALTGLDRVSSFRDIRSLQALLLYCKYGIHASLRDTSSEMWEALGKATRLCVEIGLHHNPSTTSSRCNLHITGQISPAVQVEMQRRCFWCYYNLDRIVNISLGRPLALHDDDIHVPLPSAADDDTLDQVSSATSSTLPATSPFLQHTQYRRIQSKIHRCMYTSRLIQELPLTQRQAIRREIFEELQAWRQIIELLPLSPLGNSHPISSSYLHPSWYQALYHSGCLLLFRPSATFPAMEGLEPDQDKDDVLQIIWTSSRHVLSKYSELLRARHLNYSWVCLYTIFMAGLANVYSVGCCARRRKRGVIAFLPSFWDVVSDFRDYSNMLTAICERWADARGSREIFNSLSQSALKELAGPSFRGDVSRADPANGQGTAGTPVIPQTEQPFATSGFMHADMSLDHLPEDGFAEFGPAFDFQQMFQEMQSSINTGGYGQTDEVMLGFSQEWFER